MINQNIINDNIRVVPSDAENDNIRVVPSDDGNDNIRVVPSDDGNDNIRVVPSDAENDNIRVVPSDDGNDKTSSISSSKLNGNLTPEMQEWLTDNRFHYEFYLVHAMMHDSHRRNSLITVPVLPDDFTREEYELVVHAILSASKIMGVIGNSLPNPPTVEWLRTYVESASRFYESDIEVVEDAMKLVKELQDPSFTEMHYCISPYFEAWYGALRAKKAARKLNEVVIPDVQGQISNMQAALDAARQLDGDTNDCEFDYDKRPERPEAILKLGDYSICTPGNISNIQGPPKTAKSAVVGAILAATLKEPCKAADTLGFTAEPPAGRGVLHFDTEQSRHDHDSLVCRAYSRAQRTKEADWLHSYNLTGMEPVNCWDFLLRKLKKAVDEHSGVMMVIIDGIADFCLDPNDATECFELVLKLLKLAADYKCAVITVLHENPSQGNPRFAKPRGHLGSQLERKAETMLKLSKDSTGISVIWADLARHCFIPKGAGWRLRWCDDAKMHVTLLDSDEAVSSPKPDKIDKYRKEAAEAFGADDVMSHTELWKRIEKTVGVQISAAKKRITKYVILKLVEKDTDGKYRIIRVQIPE